MLRRLSSNSEKNGFWNIKCGRLHLTLVLSLAFLSNCLIFNTLSMAVVCMVNSTAITLITNKTRGRLINLNDNESTCDTVNNVKTEYEGTFVWTHIDQGFLFSALFIGGVISILPSGWLSDRYNPKAIVTLGLFVSTLGCFLTPVTAYYGGYIALFVLRLIMGLFGIAIIMSGMSSICARWIPPAERTTVLAMYTSGNQIANIIGMPMNAALCRSKYFLNGWPAIFYVNGSFGIVAIILWMIYVTNVPDTNKFVSEQEKIYINLTLANQNLGKRKEAAKNVPWKKIISSPVIITCFLCNFTNGFLVAILMTYIPTYFKEALSLDLKRNGFFSALPYICQMISKMVFAVVADHVKKRTTISHTLIAKCFNTVGAFGTSVFLVACAYMDCTKPILAVLFLSLANTLFSATIPGWAACLLSLAPAYTGIIGAIGRFAGQIGAVLSPYVVSLIVVEGNVYEWKMVFFVIAACVSVSGILFIIFGSANLQEWAKQPTVEAIKDGNEQLLPKLINSQNKSTNHLEP